MLTPADQTQHAPVLKLCFRKAPELSDDEEPLPMSPNRCLLFCLFVAQVPDFFPVLALVHVYRALDVFGCVCEHLTASCCTCSQVGICVQVYAGCLP